MIEKIDLIVNNLGYGVVFDNSVSQIEAIGNCIKKINEVIADTNTNSADVAELETALQLLQTALQAEATARENADIDIGDSIEVIATGLETENSRATQAEREEGLERQYQDLLIRNSVTAEATARANADTVLQENISAEITTRISAINAMGLRVGEEEAVRSIQNNSRIADMVAEIARATAKENELQNDVDTVELSVQNLVTDLNNEITFRLNADTAEATARANADIDLQSQIDNIVVGDIGMASNIADGLMSMGQFSKVDKIGTTIYEYEVVAGVPITSVVFNDLDLVADGGRYALKFDVEFTGGSGGIISMTLPNSITSVMFFLDAYNFEIVPMIDMVDFNYNFVSINKAYGVINIEKIGSTISLSGNIQYYDNVDNPILFILSGNIDSVNLTQLSFTCSPLLVGSKFEIRGF